MEIPFLGGAYEGRSKTLNAQRSINIFPAYDNNDAKVVLSMYGTPGNTQFSLPGVTAISRAMEVLGDKLYAVIGATVYEITTAGVATSLGVITTSTGHVGMASNGTQILVVDGTAYGHIITAGTLTDISDADFPSSEDCVFFDGYFVVNITATGRIAISKLYDGLVWDALDFATAEASPDGLVGIGATKQNIWLLGELTGEVYYDSGNATFPFERVPGAIIDIGCRAVGSIVNVDGQVFWLTNKDTVVKSSGYSFEPVSSPGINYQLSTYTTLSDAIGFTYTLEGRTFYVLNFPTHDKTWVLDINSGQWHEWQSLDDGGVAGQFRGVSGVMFNKKALIGDRSNGKIYTLSMDEYLDNGLDIRRIRRAQIISKEKANILFHEVEIEFESGVGLNVGAGADGYDPQANLKWSDDDCNTWTPSSGASVSMGKYQEYEARQRWRLGGKSRNRVFELTIEEPVKCVLVNQYASLEALRF